MLMHPLGNDRMAHMMPNANEQNSDEEGSDVSDGDGCESKDGEVEDITEDDTRRDMIGPFDEDWMEAVVQVISRAASHLVAFLFFSLSELLEVV